MQGTEPNRLPDPRYLGRNGFAEILVPLGNVERDISATNNHRLAEFVLLNKGSYFPTLQEMRDELDRPPPDADLAGIDSTIKGLRRQHSADLDNLYRLHAQEYLDDAMDRYLSRDETQYLASEEKNVTTIASYTKLDEIYADRNFATYLPNWESDITRLRHAYLKHELHPAFEKRTKLIKLRRLRDAQFPATLSEYRAMRNKDVQLRVARFLKMGLDMDSETGVEGGKKGQEKMMNEFGWAWRQVKTLMEEFEHNTVFRAEVLDMVRDVEVKDPRKKR